MSLVWGVVLVALSFSQLVDGHCLDCKVDVCFILDMSGCASKWSSARSVIRTLVYMMNVRPDTTQVGLVQFAGQAQPEFDLDDHDNKADVLNAIDSLSQDGGCTNISTGLDAVRTDCFGAGHGERAGIRRLVIMVTDGKSSERGDDPGAAATALTNDNVTIFAVGVDNPDVPTINVIANNVTANTFLPGRVLLEPVLLTSGIYIFGSVVTALFERFKEFCANETTTTTGQPMTTSTSDPASIRDCNDVTGGSGRLQINIATPGQTPAYHEVLCENGWMVLLMRKDGSVNFVRSWADYRDGFGQLDGEFWAGLELMHHVTNNGQNYRLRVDFEPYDSSQHYAEYSSFSVGPPEEFYKLHVSGYNPISSLGESLAYHNGLNFTTIDQDHDAWSTGNCAQQYGQGGWWYLACGYVWLTGQYGEFPAVAAGKGIRWQNPFSATIFAQRASMKIRHT